MLSSRLLWLITSSTNVRSMTEWQLDVSVLVYREKSREGTMRRQSVLVLVCRVGHIKLVELILQKGWDGVVESRA